MAIVVKLGEKQPSEARAARGGFGAGVAAQWRSPAQRARISILAAVILLAVGAFGIQVLPSIRAALFPVASRDLPADADPSPLPTREDAGVFDRTVPGGIKMAGEDGKTPVTTEDPTERPFVRGAPPAGR